MLTKELIDRFYKDFESLNLLRPNAVMKDATGMSSGQISDYLNRKKQPSERFIKLFYEKVYNASTNVPRDTMDKGHEKAAPTSTDEWLRRLDLLLDNNRMLAEAQLLLARRISLDKSGEVFGEDEPGKREGVELLQPSGKRKSG